MDVVVAPDGICEQLAMDASAVSNDDVDYTFAPGVPIQGDLRPQLKTKPFGVPLAEFLNKEASVEQM
jgi:hypothetical protein